MHELITLSLEYSLWEEEITVPRAHLTRKGVMVFPTGARSYIFTSPGMY